MSTPGRPKGAFALGGPSVDGSTLPAQGRSPREERELCERAICKIGAQRRRGHS